MKRASLLGSVGGLGLALCVAVCGCSGTQHSDKSSKDLVQWLQGCQRAGYERHELTTYLSQWAADATIVAARGPDPGPHDRVLNRTQIDRTRAERYYKGPTSNKILKFNRISTSIQGSRAEVRWWAHSTHADGQEMVAERYVLRRLESGQWRVVRNRFWPIWTQEKGHPRKQYSETLWRRLDAWADRPACFGGPCPSRLLTAWRFVDAWRAAIRMTERPGSAPSWSLRGICAVLSGHVADAAPSFARALQLDASISLPPWRSASLARHKLR